MHPPPPAPPRSSCPNNTTRRVHPSDRIHHHHHHVGDGGGSSRPAATTTSCRRPCAAADQHQPAEAAVRYTVWKRSSMGFHGTDGFSVYDAHGGLAFRVDNYARRRKLFAGELLLMDGHGAPLLALRPHILSMRDQWDCYRASSPPGEAGGGGERWSSDRHGRRRQQQQQQRLFSMRRCSLVAPSGGDEAEVHVCSQHHQQQQQQTVPSFRVQGSFRRRSCKIIRSGDGEEVARITRKNKAGAAGGTLGDDVFSLTVAPRPDDDCAMVMAFVVVMDRICHKPYTPFMCSS